MLLPRVNKTLQKTMTILNLFPIPVYRNFYPKTRELKLNLFPKLDSVFSESEQKNNVFMRRGTICSYDSNPNLHHEFPKETQHVVEFVEKCAREYWKECNYYEQLEPYLFQLWANQTPKGGYIESHLHGNMPFTGILYVDASPAQGNLVLENPLEMILMNQPIGPNTKYPIGEEIEIGTGDLIMFPGFIRHSVRINNLESPRLILAFNIGSKGNYWTSQFVS